MNIYTKQKQDSQIEKANCGYQRGEGKQEGKEKGKLGVWDSQTTTQEKGIAKHSSPSTVWGIKAKRQDTEK